MPYGHFVLLAHWVNINFNKNGIGENIIFKKNGSSVKLGRELLNIKDI
jgi:hypothetical protein